MKEEHQLLVTRHAPSHPWDLRSKATLHDQKWGAWGKEGNV